MSTQKKELEMKLREAKHQYLHWSTCLRVFKGTPESKQWYAQLALDELEMDVTKRRDAVIYTEQKLQHLRSNTK